MRVLVLFVTVTCAATASADPLPFDIASARGGAQLAFSATAAPTGPTHVSRAVRVVVAGDGAPSREGLVVLDPILLETDSGDQAELHPSPASLAPAPPAPPALAAGSHVTVTLSGDFAKPGAYRGEVILLQGTRQRAIPIAVSIAAPAAPAALPPLPVAVHGGLAVAVDGHEHPVLALRLGNTGPDPITVTLSFAGASRLDKAAADHPLLVAAAHAPPATSNLAPNAIAPLELAVDGLDEPGIYQVEALVRDAGTHAPLAITATIYRRAAVWWAALFIALGAAVAMGTRAWLTGGRDRLALRRRAARLAEDLRAASPRADALAAAHRLLSRDVEERQRELRWGGALTEISAALDRAELRLFLLSEITAALAELAALDIAQQTTPRATLDTALVAVRIDPGTADAITAQRREVGALALAGAHRTQAQRRLSDLRDQIKQQLRGAAESLRLALTATSTALAAADAALASGRYAAVERLVDEGRASVLTACIAELERVATPKRPPRGADANAWLTTTADITRLLTDARAPQSTWRERTAAFDEAQKLYLTAAITGLAADARARAERELDDARKQHLRALADGLDAALRESISAAAAIYPARLAEITAAEKLRGGEESASTPRGWSLLSFLADAEPTEPNEPARASSPSSAALGRAQLSRDWIVTALVFGVAVASGVKTLWADDLAWGGRTACLIAFLWGTSVQVVGDALAGALALRAKLGGAHQD